MIAVLCGGVGAARLLAGARRVVAGGELVAVVNTGDDLELFGLSVSPDLDTITYTLAGEMNPESGWGRRGESFRALGELGRFGAPTWFGLGDLDLATHLYRSGRLAEGACLSEVTAEIAAAFGVTTRLLPMTDDRVRTRLRLEGGEEVAFQEYFVHRRHSVAVDEVHYEGAELATPAPGVAEALAAAEVVLIAPSNPIVSIGPILSVPGVADALFARRSSVVAVSPIVGGVALKGPADRLLVELGGRSSVGGVAECLAEVAGTLVIDRADAALAGEVEAEGMRAVVADTVMRDPAVAEALTEVAIAAARP
ncbi:MAG TPA: 2-phospho-L-lactate transferase [Acidimicrobiales bacterium]|nr:2-phospho-L-lactate transferase [Acidimicrobiales bacterium]